jgi:hypothetical protein
MKPTIEHCFNGAIANIHGLSSFIPSSNPNQCRSLGNDPAPTFGAEMRNELLFQWGRTRGKGGASRGRQTHVPIKELPSSRKQQHTTLTGRESQLISLQ